MGSSDSTNLQNAELRVVPPMAFMYCMNIGTNPKHTADITTAAIPMVLLLI